MILGYRERRKDAFRDIVILHKYTNDYKPLFKLKIIIIIITTIIIITIAIIIITITTVKYKLRM